MLYFDTQAKLHWAATVVSARRLHRAATVVSARRLHLAATVVKGLIYRNIKNKEDQIALQKDLNLLENWGNTWGMRFNAAKCNIMRVSWTRDPKLFNYSLTGQVLGEIMDAKYLGVTLSNDLEWSKHIATMTNRANSKLSFLRSNLKGCSVELQGSSRVGIRDTLVFLICLRSWSGRLFLKGYRRLDLSCFTKLLTVWHKCPSKASLSRRIRVLEENTTLNLDRLAIQLASMDSRFS